MVLTINFRKFLQAKDLLFCDQLLILYQFRPNAVDKCNNVVNCFIYIYILFIYFSLSKLKTTHIWIHGKDRMFSCPTCSKAVKTKKQLRNHMVLHNILFIVFFIFCIFLYLFLIFIFKFVTRSIQRSLVTRNLLWKSHNRSQPSYHGHSRWRRLGDQWR